MCRDTGIDPLAQALSISERRACAALGQHRSTQRKIPRGREDEQHLTDDLVALARKYGRLSCFQLKPREDYAAMKAKLTFPARKAQV